MAALTAVTWQADTSAATGPPGTVATSATSGTVKTILQLKPLNVIRIVEWGYGFDVAPSASFPCRVELVETGTVFATVTTIGSGVLRYNNVTGSASSAVVSTTATGFNASAEGSVVASRLIGYNYETGIYFKQQYPLGREPEVNAGAALRIRATPTQSVALNMWAYVVWEE
jgi:hypothetical protein